MDPYTELLGIVDALSLAGVEYAVCGGVALAIHGYPRFTKDIDLLVREEDLDAVRKAVAARGFTVEGGRIPFGLGRADERVVYRISKVASREVLTLDLLLVSPVLEDVWADRRVARWQGRDLQVVSRQGLATMKRLAGRDQDLVDVRRLEGGETEAPEGE
jgi:hypothetical protein